MVVNLASIMGYSEVGYITELVPADVSVIAKLHLQTNSEGLGIRGPIETTCLKKENIYIKLVYMHSTFVFSHSFATKIDYVQSITFAC